MSLRVRLFLLLGSLVFLLVTAQWWLVRALTRDLSGELGQVVMVVGHHLVTSLPNVEVLEEGDRTAPMAFDIRIHETDSEEGEHLHEEKIHSAGEHDAPVDPHFGSALLVMHRCPLSPVITSSEPPEGWFVRQA